MNGETARQSGDWRDRLRAPWPFTAFALTLIGLAFVLMRKMSPSVGFMTAFDVAAAFYVAAAFATAGRQTPEEARAHADRFEPSRPFRLVLTLTAVAAVAAALWAELSHAASQPLGLALGTLAVAWVFSNVAFAGHYAHLYYRSGAGDAPLDFPGEDPPDFWDFAYFSFVLGMTFQVSDVTIRDRAIRRHALLHGVLAFTFSLGALALSVNLVASKL